MNNLPLITLLSSLISQILLLLFLLFPPSTFSLIHPIPNPHDVVPTLLHHFLLSTAAAAAVTLPKKRKRLDHDNGGGADKLSCLDSVVPRTPHSFQQLFKMKPSSFEWLCSLLEPLLECRDPVESPLSLPAEIRLGIGLLRLATGADFPEIAARFRVSESDARFCVKHLCRVLCTNYRFWVAPPSQPELESVSTRIQTLAGIPNCCGTIGCVRFNFNSHSNSNPTAVAAQIVADSASRILNIAAGFRGVKRDSQILKSSSLFSDVSRSLILHPPQYLIGNGEYPLLPWLILPFPNPVSGSPEENFNAVHRLIRSSWKKSIASLRNWGILDGSLEIEYKEAVASIGACSILHNMLIMRDDYSAFCDGFDDDAYEDDVGEISDRSFGGESGEEVRKALAAMVKR